jgi:SAM-dependent methyltransferase
VAALAGLTCPACGGELAPWRSVPGGEPSDRGEYELVRCRSCSTAISAGPAPGVDAYESGQYSARPPRARKALERIQLGMMRQPVRLLRRAGLPTGARVLDIGAGQGRLVEALVNGGYEGRGIDSSRRSVELARASGRDIALRDVASHSDSGLGAAVFWHVLEHLDDAPGALASVHRWVEPGGLLLVGVPNVSSVQARIAGPAWLHWDLPRHRVHFTPDGLTRLLQSSGFEVVRTRHLVPEQNFHAMWMALLTRLGMRPAFPFHFLKRNIDARPRDLALTVLGIPLLPVAIVLEAAAALMRRGGTIAVVARRI